MFCPKCKSEYRSGFTSCAVCEVPLVDHLESDSGIPKATHPTNLRIIPPDVGEEVSDDTIDTNCPACGEDLAQNKETCPHCGLSLIFDHDKAQEEKAHIENRVKSWERVESRKKLLLLLLFAFGIFMIYLFLS